MEAKYKRLKFACYASSMSMAVVTTMSPLLFSTFTKMYGISYSLIGLLVLINFVTQLLIDLVFSFFSHKFNLPLTVKLTPVICFVGLVVYALSPVIFPHHIYAGICLGTIIFSAASGLGEVLTSPVIASIPSDDPDREMSKLHSMYAWGVVGVVIISTIFLHLAGRENWAWLAVVLSVIPFVSAIAFLGTRIPSMQATGKAKDVKSIFKNSGVWLCVAIIFCGGSSECTMAQWSSVYLEQALGIPKVWGDVFGMALFSVMLGIGRTLYAKRGRSIEKVLLISTTCAALCYFVAAVSPFATVGLLACVVTGIATAMLWPGTLIVATERYKEYGVLIFALMASGGDLGASVGPQLVGLVTDAVISAKGALSFAQSLGMSVEQLAMKAGMLVAMIFPLIAIPLNIKSIKKGTQK